MKKKLVCLSAILTLLQLSSCSPGLSSKISVDVVNESEIKALAENVSNEQTKVNVMQFQDNRTIEAIAQIDGRLIKTDSDVGAIVQKSFERDLRASGVKLTLFDSPSIRGAVKEWQVSVVPGFPSTNIEAVATIEVELIDQQAKIVHKSLYTGNYQEENPFMSESKVKAALGKAMGYAISEALSDPQFINNLTSIQSGREEVR